MVKEQLGFAMHLLFHPFDGFSDLKYERKRRNSIPFILLGLLFIVVVCKRQFTGYIVNDNDLRDLHMINELLYVVLPFFVWCIANWLTTTLMDGEGKFSEIIMVTGYSLIPLILLFIPQMFLSNVITQEESAVYYLIDSIAYIWFVWLLFIGTMVVHQYSLGKTIFTSFLTMVVIGVMAFLCILGFSLLQQMMLFFYTIYQELMLRS